MHVDESETVANDATALRLNNVDRSKSTLKV